MNDNTVKDKWR